MAHYKSQLDAEKGHNGGINERKTTQRANGRNPLLVITLNIKRLTSAQRQRLEIELKR